MGGAVEHDGQNAKSKLHRSRGRDGCEGNHKRWKRSGKGTAPVKARSGDEGAAVDRELRAAGFAVPSAVREGLLSFFDLLLSWGQRINLTAARSVEALAS